MSKNNAFSVVVTAVVAAAISLMVVSLVSSDRTVYGNFEKIKKGRRRRRKWYEELREERIKDIQAEMQE